MALPSGIVPKTVTIGIASFFDGTLADGTATITAPVNVVHTPTNRPIFSSVISQKFVDGVAQFTLAPTDAPGLNNVGWTYKLGVTINGALVQPDPIYFTLPAAGPDTIDLDSLVTVPGSAGVPVSVQAVTVADISTPTSDAATALRVAFGLSVAATVSTSGALTVGKFTPVDATAAARAMTLPTGAADGVSIGVEKVDASTNAVSVTGNIRGVPATTITLPWAHETLLLRADAQGSWWPTAGHKTKTSLDATYAPVKAQLRGNRAVWLGDSVTSAQGNDTASNNYGLSTPTYAHYLSKGRLRRLANAGIPGNTSADMLARFDTDVTPFAPSVVLIMAGTNDWNDASTITTAQYAANMQALVAKCRAIGAQPVLYTIPPNVLSTTRRRRVTAGNAWLRRYCAAEGINLIDAYNLLVDPATGDYLAAYGTPSNDKTHPFNAGYVALGSLTATTLAASLPVVDQLLPMENADPNNLVTNSLNLTTTGSGTTLMPTGWSVQTSVHPTGVTGSLVTGDTAIKGNWWKIVADGSATAINNEFLTISTGIVPGHVYAHVGRFKATGLRNADTGSGSSVLIGAAFNSVLNNVAYDFRAVSTHSYDVADGAFYQEFTAPSDAANLLVRRQLINTTAGAGTLQIAQQGVYDLTAMGLA